MPIEQPRDLNRNLFTSLRWTLNLCGLGDIMCHCNTHAAENLDAFCDGIDQFGLFLIMFVKQQVKLIKRRSGNLPVCFFVQIAKRHRICQQLVQLRADLFTYRSLKIERQSIGYRSIGLDLRRSLMKAGLRFIARLASCPIASAALLADHLSSLSPNHYEIG